MCGTFKRTLWFVLSFIKAVLMRFARKCRCTSLVRVNYLLYADNAKNNFQAWISEFESFYTIWKINITITTFGSSNIL